MAKTIEEKVAAKKAKKESRKGLWKEFKAFISKGNVVDMAVGVIIASAFGAIVTAVVNILLSLCTWGLPGGIKGLVTILPAAYGTAQGGVEGIGQAFGASELTEATITYAATQNATITPDDASYINWQNALLSKYTAHGGTYIYNGAAIIDWGTLLNAVISFLVIAIVLFTVVKVTKTVTAKNDELKKKALEDYYKKHPDERPAPAIPGVPAPTETELLAQIRDLLAKQQAAEKPAPKE